MYGTRVTIVAALGSIHRAFVLKHDEDGAIQKENSEVKLTTTFNTRLNKNSLDFSVIDLISAKLVLSEK